MKFKWTKIEEDVSIKIKWIVAQNVLLSYPNLKKEVKMYTDVSNLQLLAVIR